MSTKPKTILPNRTKKPLQLAPEPRPVEPEAFVLPNGSSLRYAFRWSTKWDAVPEEKWVRTRLTDQLLNHKPACKEDHVRLGLWTSRSNQHVVAADYDKVPQGYPSFDALDADLRHRLAGKAIVVRSVSGIKVKAFFVVETSGPMSEEVALEALRVGLCINSLFEAADKTRGGLSLCFVNRAIIEALNTSLPSLPVIRIEYPQSGEEEEKGRGEVVLDCIPCSPRSGFGGGPRRKVHLDPFQGEIPEALIFWTKGNPARETFIRLLLKFSSLLKNKGFEIGTSHLANEVSRITGYKVSQKSVWTWRLELEKMGWLSKISNKFYPGSKAYGYVASGALRSAMGLVRAHRPVGNPQPLTLPTVIEDKTWEETLWAMVPKFSDRPASEFIDWVRTIPGYDKKGRMEKAERAIERWKQYISSPKAKKGSQGAA